jgi:putative hydroxymethylpyrimidine transport system ATP-binding protein
MQAPAIQISGLTLEFGSGSVIFDRLNLDISAGRTTAILGPSGCGKSSLLRLLSGTNDFSCQGSIQFIPAADASIAWMSQDDLLLPWMNLKDNILLGHRLRGEVTEARCDTAQELIDRAGLSGYESSFPASLSGGMRQRGALLRTLMEERSVLLMDEPFSALDALTRIKLQNLAAELTDGTTVVLVTHDAGEALRMADRIYILEGTPARVKKQIELSTRAPRRIDSPEVLDHYGPLISLLLEEVR